jgi:carboxymethylenebutenolidase
VRTTGAGGEGIEAYRAVPLDEGSRGGVVVIHHMPGWDEGSKEITRRFAAMGWLAVCPNLYSREAPGADPDDAAAAARAAGGVPDERLVGDVAGAAEHLRGLPGSNGRVATIGYCSGGRQSVLAGLSLDLDAAVDCYGAFVTGTPPEGYPLQVAPLTGRLGELRCPLLGLFGAEDAYPSPEHVAELDRELTRLGKEHEFTSYEGAGHAFFATDRPSYRPEAAKDGWRRISDFFGRHLSTPAAG